MTQSQPIPEPPRTGVPEIDAALAALDLSGPVATRKKALADAHAVLQAVLNSGGRGK